MTRTYWLIDGYHTIASVSLTALVIQLALLVLESWTKRVNANNEDQKVPAEETAGFVSRSLFLWLNGIFWIGYHRSLSAVDLRPTDGLLNASHLSQRFGNIMRGAPCAHICLYVEDERN